MWGKAVKVARLRGIDIKLDASWFLIAGLIVWSLATVCLPDQMLGADTATLIASAVLAVLGFIGSLVLHELAHAEVAGLFGLRTSGITLFVFGGLAELQSAPASGQSEFWIAIAGPIASFGLALAFWFTAQIAGLLGAPDPARVVLSCLAALNLMLALFNLLPAFPLDGGRILRAWLWTRSGDLLTATRRAIGVSTVFACGFIGLGLYAAFTGTMAAGLWPILIGLFVLATSRATLAQLEAKSALQGRTVADMMSRNLWTAHPEQTLSDLVNRLFLEHGITFAPVVEDGMLLGYVDLQIVCRIDRENWTTTTVEDVIEKIRPEDTVSPQMAGLDLMSLMIRTGRRKIVVADRNEVIGVVTLSDVLAHLSVFREVATASAYKRVR